ncbi:MAG: AAA family ATPase [Ruminiclostridium sp.]|nr:AAA family ATPase [Ruminiclostridium sp.]
MAAAFIHSENNSVIWEEVIKYLEGKIREISLKTWIKSIEGICFNSTTCILTAPSSFNKYILDMRYFDLLENAVNSVTASDFALNIIAKSDDIKNVFEAKDDISVSEEHIINRLNPAYTFGNFVSGSCNKKALIAALKAANTNMKNPNPLIIFGGTGTGKTHLLHAIGNDYKKNDETARIQYMGIDDCISELMRQIQTDNQYSFEKKLEHLDLLLIDDLHHIEGKNRTLLELVSLFNRLKSKSVKLILATSKPIEKIINENHSLLTEAESIVKVYKPDFYTKKKILKQYIKMYGITLSNDTVELIARVEYQGVRELKGAR